jgi:hypothetical protein
MDQDREDYADRDRAPPPWWVREWVYPVLGGLAIILCLVRASIAISLVELHYHG